MPISKKKKPIPETADNGQSKGRITRTRLWLFDMDDTLFDASAGMFASIHRKMESFIADKLDLNIEDAAKVQNDYWRIYGATFLGLEKHKDIAPDDFFNATHSFDLSPFVKTHRGSESLRRLIAKLPGKKVVITNGPAIYAKGVLACMKLTDVFDDVISANDMNRLGQWRCKPDKTLFLTACAQMGVKPELTTIIEDSPSNLKAAKSLGLMTVWCDGYRQKPPHQTQAHVWADWVVNDIADLVRKFARAKTKID
ncbi:MAG: pyrimidine 5'-nucleotidase [Sutterellaceae bacterium]|nr:pyrimidine 5'-nucleotidase [Sutterellaceae bacterium]